MSAFMAAYRHGGGDEAYRRALEHFRAAEDAGWQLETLWCRATFSLPFIDDAEVTLANAVEMLRLAKLTAARDYQFDALMQLGSIHAGRGDPQKALEYYREAVATSQAEGDVGDQVRSLDRLGDNYEALGELQNALDFYSQAEALAGSDNVAKVEAMLRKSEIYNQLGLGKQALTLLASILEMRRAEKQPMHVGLTLASMGQVYSRMGKLQEALRCFAEAITWFQNPGIRGEIPGTLLQVASVYQELGDSQRALRTYEEALSFGPPVDSLVGSARAAALLGLGKALTSPGETSKASGILFEALDLFQKAGSWAGEAETLRALSDLEAARGNLEHARAYIDKAMAMVESVRGRIASPGSRASYLASNRRFYESAISLLMKLRANDGSTGNEAEAFQVSERARARSLLDMLADARVDVRQGADPSLIGRLRALRSELSAKDVQRMRYLNDPAKAALVAARERQIRALLLDYEATEAKLRESSPRYSAVVQPQPYSLRDIQDSALDSNTTLLEYFLANPRSYVWAVTASSVSGFELPSRTEIESAAQAFYSAVTARQPRTGESPRERQLRIARAAKEFPAAAECLARMILGPVAPRLRTKRLVIVPDGALHYIPFSALPDPGACDTAAGCPLIATHEIALLPSAGVLMAIRSDAAGRPGRTRSIAVFADPVFDREDPRVQKHAPRDEPEGRPVELQSVLRDVGFSPDSIPRLIASREEAEAVTRLTSPDRSLKALDFMASRRELLDTKLDDFRILHFATHALLNSTHPELSGLVLSLVDENGAPQNGFVRLQDVFNMRLAADMVVLSACSTALGKDVSGEGLVGLTRGFMYAGARSVLASLWNIDDEASAEFMKSFYRKVLADGVRPSIALRSAQLEIRKDKRWQAPYYWAAFVLQGEW